MADDADPGEFDDPELDEVRPPTLRLVLALLAVAAAGGCAVVGRPPLAAIGYGLALVAVLLAGLYRMATQRLRDTDRHFSPSAGADWLATSAIGMALVAALANGWSIAAEISRNVKLFGLLLLSAFLVVGLPPRSVEAQSGDSGDDTAFVYARFRDCVSSGRTGLAAILMDESGSLRDTDENDDRVRSIQSTLANLDALRTHFDATVEVLVAGFSVGYEERLEWTHLDDRSIESALEQAEIFADLDTGIDTDYYLGLAGVSESLTTKIDEYTLDGEQPCTILFWITDGLYEIEDRDTSQLVDRYGSTKDYAPDIDLSEPGGGELLVLKGIDLLCEADGVADDLRREGVGEIAYTIVNDEVTERAYEVVDRIVGGASSSGVTCGSLPSGGERVSEPEFDPPIGTTVELIEIGPLVGSFSFDAIGSGGSLAPAELVEPGGSSIVLTRDEDEPFGQLTGDVDGNSVRWRWFSADHVHVDVTLAPDARSGVWEVVPPPGVQARKTVVLTPGFDLAVAGQPKFRPGETTEIHINVLGRAGTAIPVDELGPFLLSGQVRLGNEEEFVDLPMAAGEDGLGYRGSLPIPADTAATTLTLRLTGDPNDGSTLEARIVDLDFDILAPPGYPQIGPPEPVRIEGAASAIYAVPVTGDPDVGGCVSITSVTFDDAPADVIDRIATVDLPDGCHRVEAGEEIVIEVPVESLSPAAGTARGLLTARAESDVSAEPRTSEVGIQLRLVQPIDKDTQLAVFLLLIIGLLIPLFALYALQWWLARFYATDNLWWFEAPVTVTPDAIEPGSATELLRHHDEQLRSRGGRLVADGPTGPPQIDGYRFGRHISLNPFVTPVATATRDGAVAMIGSKHHFGGRRRRSPTAHLEFGLRREWVVAIEAIDDEADPPMGRGQLLLFVDDRDDVTAMADHIARECPKSFASLIEILDVEPGGNSGSGPGEDPSPDDPWPGDPWADPGQPGDGGDGGYWDDIDTERTNV